MQMNCVCTNHSTVLHSEPTRGRLLSAAGGNGLQGHPEFREAGDGQKVSCKLFETTLWFGRCLRSQHHASAASS